ncbi:hypothetical protein GOBAR_AA12414 [Gossypium barbadense]|uniref:Uncharacterized protein n=1 Tax=Gossypium barbadense TaxID=3634 RepID=A0A2P5XY23_GOSBA|nr:hypothetical protein GOBAR_AA12414 [Gossypium barbadense]
MIRLEEDTPVVVEVGFYNHSVQRRGYRGGRVGHGSRGEPFLVEFQLLRIIGQGNDKIGGGYSGGGRGWVLQPQCPAKRLSWWSGRTWQSWRTFSSRVSSS